MSLRMRIWLIEVSPACFLCNGDRSDIWGNNCVPCKGQGRLVPQIHVEEHQNGTMLTLLAQNKKSITCTREEFEAVKHMGNFVTEPFTETVGDTH